jgi:putative spermidine/putrescine transport system ATP-binding protein
MDHGRIDQAGTANEIFNRPTIPYVARFMGGQNALTGTVESASSGMARLRGPRGEIFDAPSSPAPTIGTPVSIAVRRDRIHVGRAPGEKTELQPNSVAGVVESTEFQGNFVKVNILVEGGGPFVANVSDEEYFAELVKPGDHVAPRWNPEHVHILSKADSNNAQKPYSDE